MWWILIYSWTGGWKQGSHGGKQIIWRQRLQHVGPRSEANNIKVIYVLRWTCSHRGWSTSKLVQQQQEEALQQEAVRAEDRVHYEAGFIKSSALSAAGTQSHSSCLKNKSPPHIRLQSPLNVLEQKGQFICLLNSSFLVFCINWSTCSDLHHSHKLSLLT